MLAWTIGGIWWDYRRRASHHAELASLRSPLTVEQFHAEMGNQGVSDATSRFVLSRVEFAYLASLKPDPNHRIFSDLHVLTEDAVEFVNEYFGKFGGSWPESDTPVLDDPSLLELGLFLEQRRKR